MGPLNNLHKQDKNIKLTSIEISNDLNINRQNLENVFLKNCDDINYTTLNLNINKIQVEILLVYSTILSDSNKINESIVKPINQYNINNTEEYIDKVSVLNILEETVNLKDINKTSNFDKLVKEVLSGSSILIINHCNNALILNTKQIEHRSISESSIENVIRGPRDSFIENIDTNLGLIRSRIKSHSLKIEDMTIGSETLTKVSITYMENKVNKTALLNLKDKLKQIETESILDTSYIEDFIENHTYSPFPQTQITERPDKVCGNLLNGKIVILADGSPIALIIPISFFELFQSSEDYYTRIAASNFLRLLRFVGFIIALSFSAIYVALISFHHEMIPMNLLVDLSETRTNVPFPPVIEAILMEITVELIREASNRLPDSIGQTIGIVGALVIGDAAIQSNFASPTMVIVVAITSIGSYIFPHYNTSYSLRIIRFPIIIMAATFGAFGIIISLCWVLIHLSSLDSFGYPYFSPLAPLDKTLLKDGVIRKPLRSKSKR